MADTSSSDPDLRFRSIGEAAAETGVKPHILRYWEDCFVQLRPLKRAGGRRYYRREDLDLIRRIDDLVNRRGYTFAGARAVLAGADISTTAEDSAHQSQLSSAHRAQLMAVREELAALLSQLRGR